MPVIDMLATMENHRSSQRGTCFEADENPVAFDTAPTSAVTAKWNPVNVVAASPQRQSCFFLLLFNLIYDIHFIKITQELHNYYKSKAKAMRMRKEKERSDLISNLRE